jgi:PAS domain S-box-containing protein
LPRAKKIDQLEGALRESEEQRRLALEAAALGTWDWDVLGDRAAVDERGRQLFGFPGEGPVTYAMALAAIHPEDRALVEERVRGVLAPSSDGRYETQHRVVWPDGSIRWLFAKGQARFEGAGAERRAVRFLGTVMDITERKQTDAALRESEERLRLALEAGRMGTWDWNVRTGRLVWDARQCELFGVDPASGSHLTADDFLERVHPDDLPHVHRAMQAALAGRSKFNAEFRIVGADRREQWLLGKGDAITDPTGRPIRMIGVNYDITERKVADRALRDSEARFRGTFENAAVGMAHVGVDGKWQRVNERLCAIVGYTRDELLAKTLQDITHPDDLGASLEQAGRLLRGEVDSYRIERRYIHKQGHVVWASLTGALQRDPDGEPLYFIAVVQDITERKHSEEALADSAARLSLIADSMPALISYVDSEQRYRFVNRGYQHWFGHTREEIEGRTLREVLGEAASEAIREQVAAALAGDSVIFESMVPYREGGPRYVEARYTPHRGPTGEVLGFYALIVDISERRRAEEAMARAAAMRKAVLDAVPAHIAVLDGAGNVVATNAAWERFAIENGYRGPRPWTRVNYLAVCDAARGDRAEGAAAVARGLRAVLAGELKRFTPDAEYACHAPKQERWFELIAVPLPEGQAQGAVVMHVDMTERKEAEHALREREDQLRQAQKMEALGQLTGGIAHDFNNLLALVMMDLEMIVDLAGRNAKLRSLAEEARSVAEGGADLTQRLLAFARRQHLEPRAVQVNQLITTMVDLLQRSLGEPVEIRVVLGDDLWPAQADWAQLENAILNLAINARDAMPQGGVITITTANERVTEAQARAHPGLSPGRYVTVTVADTGEGMPPNVLERAFEPFFTTKEAGRGTGLGLSMVYGFAKQSGGQVSIRSQVGRGTEVTLCLPRAEFGVAPAELAARSGPRPGTGEAILVVEDHGPLRQRVAGALAGLGYEVVEAANAEEALKRLDVGERIDLLFTDVVMPGALDGRQLAQRVRERWPRVRVLYTSGYPDHLRRGRGDPGASLGFPLLAKPYSIEELARAVRRELDGSG